MDTKEILIFLSNLRFFKGSEQEFFKHYLTAIATLSKSSVALLLFDDGRVEEFIGVDNFSKESFLQHSQSVIKRAKEGIYAYERFKGSSYIVAIAQEGVDATLLLLIEQESKREFSNLILRVALCRDIIYDYKHKNCSLKEINLEDYFEKILRLLHSIIDEKRFFVAALRLVDEYKLLFECDRVSLGWREGEYIRPIAISHVEHFSKYSDQVKSLEAVFEESYEQKSEIYYPKDKESTLITYAHQLYLKENRLDSLYTFPIFLEERIIGVITFEKKEGEFSTKELDTIRLSLIYLAPILHHIYLKDKNIFQKLLLHTRETLAYLLGPKDSFKKLLALLFSFLLIWIIFGKMEYKIDATALLKTDNISYISAPFDGTVKDVNVSVGDFVKEGEFLISFDTQELLLKRSEIIADIIRYESEIEKARSSRELAQMKIAKAKKKQAQAELKRIDYFLHKANIYAPFDGFVVEGDREKLLGGSFSKGDVLMQIANPIGLYLLAKVKEDDIDYIDTNASAKVHFLAHPNEEFRVKIEQIVPMAFVENGNNLFFVKAKLLDPSQVWMRPGMSGVLKVEVGQKRVAWILFHKALDYFYMHLWW